jgi:hypothetical protein
MRLYRVETLTSYVAGQDEVFETVALIVPEYALSSYEFHACEYIGDLAIEFELVKRDSQTPTSSQENKVVKLEKKSKSKSKTDDK